MKQPIIDSCFLSATQLGLIGACLYWAYAAGIAISVMFVSFAVMWAINGWSQSMGSPPAIIGLSRWFPSEAHK